DSWRQFGEQLQALAAKLRTSARHPCEVSTRSRQTGDEPGPDRIGEGCCDDWDGFRRRLGSSGCRGAPRHDDIYLEGDQLGREVFQPLVFTFRIPPFDTNLPALDVTEFAQGFPECLDVDLGVGTGNRHQHTNAWGRLRLMG